MTDALNQALTRLELSDLDRLYDSFDDGHNAEHQAKVREQARRLARAHSPKSESLADLAARLHDIGLAKGRKGHEQAGAEMIATDPRFSALSAKDRRLLINAVRHHRASSGRPRSIVGKIVSDADRMASGDPASALQRAVDFRRAQGETDDRRAVAEALAHFQEKYAPGSYGRRHYFPETGEHYDKVYGPLLDMHRRQAVDEALALLDQGQDKTAAVTLDIEKGDTLLFDRYKNNPHVVKEIGVDDKGQPTINGMKLLACRIQKLMPKKASDGSLALSARRIQKLAAWRLSLGEKPGIAKVAGAVQHSGRTSEIFREMVKVAGLPGFLRRTVTNPEALGAGLGGAWGSLMSEASARGVGLDETDAQAWVRRLAAGGVSGLGWALGANQMRTRRRLGRELADMRERHPNPPTGSRAADRISTKELHHDLAPSGFVRFLQGAAGGPAIGTGASTSMMLGGGGSARAQKTLEDVLLNDLTDVAENGLMKTITDRVASSVNDHIVRPNVTNERVAGYVNALVDNPVARDLAGTVAGSTTGGLAGAAIAGLIGGDMDKDGDGQVTPDEYEAHKRAQAILKIVGGISGSLAGGWAGKKLINHYAPQLRQMVSRRGSGE